MCFNFQLNHESFILFKSTNADVLDAICLQKKIILNFQNKL